MKLLGELKGIEELGFATFTLCLNLPRYMSLVTVHCGGVIPAGRARAGAALPAPSRESPKDPQPLLSISQVLQRHQL